MERKLSARILEEWELKCPNCEKTWIAEIFWGYPAINQDVEDALEKKEIVFGGCIISENDPKWECNNCNHRWGNAEHNFENTDSFDFDKGYNLDEVYDQ